MKLWQILIMCGMLLLIGLNQSLWLDEAISAQVAKNYSYHDIVAVFSPHDFHPPLYYLMLKAWTGIAGTSATAVRLPSVIFTLITVALVYSLAGSGAALLTGLNPLLIYYSQEARMYSLVTMLLTGVVYCYIKKKYVWLNILAGLSFLTFYGSVFLLVGLTLYTLVNKKYRDAVLINIGPAMAFLIIFPLLRQQYLYSTEMRAMVSNWSLVLGRVNLKNLLLIPMKFTSGRISFYPKILYYLISGGFAALVFVRLLKKDFYAILFWLTLAIGIIFSVFTPMLQYFRFLYLLPLLALTIKKSRLITVGFLVFGLMYLLNPNNYREDWQSLSKNLNNQVFMISSFNDPVNYYRPDVKIADIRSQISGRSIQVIPYGETIHGVNHKLILAGQNYELKSIKNFRELTLEYWQLKY